MNSLDKEIPGPVIPADIADLLDEEASRINSPSFIDKDPVQFPRRFSDLRDIEIVSFLSALIAWGNRKMICRDAERLLSMMHGEPYLFVRDRAYEEIDPEINIHRTFFGRHLQWLLRAFNRIYREYPSIDSFAADKIPSGAPAPSWDLTRHLRKIATEISPGESFPHVLPSNLDTTALKRINMALRWLVRDDGIVDMGVWKSIRPSQLYIPLDVHVGNTARDLGILTRRSNDRKAVEALTGSLRQLRPEDPVFYDYALFGIGIEQSQNSRV